jgi:glc operon protein GlcG
MRYRTIAKAKETPQVRAEPNLSEVLMKQQKHRVFHKSIFAIAFAASWICSTPTYAQSLPTKPVLTLDAAREAARAAHTKASTIGNLVVVSVVDDGGHLVYLERDDGAPSGMVDAAIAKARTASDYGFPTKGLEDGIKQGHVAYLDLPGALPLEGGVPVLVNGRVIGAIGVAGGQSQDDAAAAEAGLAKMQSLVK